MPRARGTTCSGCPGSVDEPDKNEPRRRPENVGIETDSVTRSALFANNRLIHDAETRAYADRRTAEGLSRKEILRCLKRHLARRLYPLLLADLTDAAALDLT